MRLSRKAFEASFILYILSAFAPVSSYAREAETLLVRSPTISSQNLAFVYGGNIWIAEKDGTNPKRLTVNQGQVSNPRFSPDGKQIAFTGNYDGNPDVYVISVEGGTPKRITHHPASDILLGWLGDNELYFSSTREYTYSFNPRIFKINIQGTGETALPMPEAVQGSPSADQHFWAYNKDYDPADGRGGVSKLYRGGGMPHVWIFDTATNNIVDVPGAGSNNTKPQWIGNKVYFLSDRNRHVNLYSYDVKTKSIEKLTDYKDYDIKTLTSGNGVLAYEQAGKIHVYNISTNKITDISIYLEADAPYNRPRYVEMKSAIRQFDISPKGVRALFESRGEIFSVPKEKGEARNISNSPGSYEKFPSWSPDGKYISYLSDKNGAYQLVLRNQSTKGEPEYINLGDTHFYFEPIWSPDSKKLFYSDAHLNLFYIDIKTRKHILVKADKLSSEVNRTGDIFNPSWSPDSKWIAYQATLPNAVTAVFLYNLEKETHIQVTDGMSTSISPTFSKDGKYLFFLASTNIGLTNSGLHMSSYERSANYSTYALILSKNTPTLYKKESDEESVKADDSVPPKVKSEKKEKKAAKDSLSKDQSITIDTQDLSRRIIPLPIPASNSISINGGIENKLLYLDGNDINELNLENMKTSTLVQNGGNFVISSDGKTMLYNSKNEFFVLPAGTKPSSPDAGKIELKGIKLLVDPKAEWKEIFNEVWEMDKEYFYVENMHGADWPAIKVKYEKFLPSVNSRRDLNYLIGEMKSELCVGHNYTWEPGDDMNAPSVTIGMLGADYKIDHGLYQINKIYNAMNWNPGLKSPLQEPGLNIHEGDYILAINGIPVNSETSIYSYFEYQTGKQVSLKVNDKPTPDGAREIVVVPIDLNAEMSLRKMEWIERNRKRVDQLSNGEIAYVYMPDTGPEGYTLFNRYYFSQMDKKALIIDDRNNGGGSVADYVIDLLGRKLAAYWKIRDGKSFTTPANGIFGPKAMIINQNAGSGGDAMPYLFRNRGLGKLIGRTTLGILVGIGSDPQLLDGGSIKVPSFGIYDTNGKWIIENEGVAPDIFVEQTPKELIEGRDPQLERTVKVLQEEMKTYPYPDVAAPKDPVRVK